MARAKRRKKSMKGSQQSRKSIRPRFSGQARLHQHLINDNVHGFVDDQNLIYGITNNEGDQSYRIEFGDLLRVAATSSKTNLARSVESACIAGVVPDDDSFWEAARNKGFQVHRGYLGAGGRSKQDDAYLITFIMKTLYEKSGPSTIVLIAGDADYRPPLEQCLEKGWRIEIAFIGHSSLISQNLASVCHEFREFSSSEIERC